MDRNDAEIEATLSKAASGWTLDSSVEDKIGLQTCATAYSRGVEAAIRWMIGLSDHNPMDI